MFEPPPDSRAHRLSELQQPGLYASRHVVIAVAQVLAALLPHVDLSGIPVPDLHIGKPSWWPEFSPWGRLPDLLPDLEVPDWVRRVLQSAKFWLPALIAVGVAGQEYERRRKSSNEKETSKEEPAADEPWAAQRPSSTRSSRCTSSRSYSAPRVRASSRVERPSRPGSSSLS